MRGLINNRVGIALISIFEAKLIEMFPHDKILSDMSITIATPVVHYDPTDDSDDSLATEASDKQTCAS